MVVTVTTYGFRLPGEGARVTPVLRVDGSIAQRDLILLFDLPQDPELVLDQKALSWSESYQCRYRYAPPISGAGIVRATTFSVPSAATMLRLRLRPRVKGAPLHVLDCCLETVLGDVSSLILATEACS